MRDIDELKKTPGLSLKRYLILFIANLIGLYLINFGLDFKLTNLNNVIIFIFFISIINAILWPLLTKLLMPFFVWTFGIAALALNGGLIAFFGPYFGLHIEGIWIILTPLIISLISIILSTIFAIKDDEYYQSVLREAQRKRKGDIKDYPGLIIVEIDGLAYDVYVKLSKRVICQPSSQCWIIKPIPLKNGKQICLHRQEPVRQESYMEIMKISQLLDGLKKKMTIK